MVKRPTRNIVKNTAQTVDFRPNKMGFAIAALAAISLVILGFLAAYA